LRGRDPLLQVEGDFAAIVKQVAGSHQGEGTTQNLQTLPQHPQAVLVG
jgi:hypothetical protein